MLMDTILVPVTFRLPRVRVPGAWRVSVVGSFNGWDTDAHPLTRTPSGEWVTTVYLPPGRVLYSFWVDGMMWLDPNDEGRVPNAWGSEYSVRYVRTHAMVPAAYA
jgi:1,4-alpha-glucan branching enzyme